MQPDRRQMKLGLLMATGGQHLAAWRHTTGHPDAGVNIDHYRQLVQLAERAKFDLAFIADTVGLRDWPLEAVCRAAHNSFQLEPVTLMSALASYTTRIGLAMTMSTTYTQPYRIARQLASLDLISGGRAAWNVVTSTQTNEASNFGHSALFSHAERYARATEFVKVVKGLWSTSDKDIFKGDKQSGQLFDAGSIHGFNHSGPCYTVDGILNVPLSPQGRPVLVQAGSSGAGRQLAAEIGEVVFATHPEIRSAQEYYSDLKRRAAAFGRPAEALVVMPGIIPVLGETRQEALDKRAELDALLDPGVAIAVLSELVGGVDLSGFPLDAPLHDLSESNRSRGIKELIYQIAGTTNMTLAALAQQLAAGYTHLSVAGTATDVANVMEAWFKDGACDGFLVSTLMPPLHAFDEFTRMVVPELQRRGLFRKEYAGETLRENLGIGRWQPTLSAG